LLSEAIESDSNSSPGLTTRVEAIAADMGTVVLEGGADLSPAPKGRAKWPRGVDLVWHQRSGATFSRLLKKDRALRIPA
jgi:hypothetical protein